MAVRPPDFKSSGIRAERIIASGSSANPRLLLIGSGASGNDGVTVDTGDLILAGTGSDTWLFVSGAIGGDDRVTFGGDVYISGSLLGVGVSATAAGSSTQVQFNTSNAFDADPGFVYDKSTQTLTVGNLTVTGSLTSISSSEVRVVDPIIVLGSGSLSINSDGGIAIASGSSVTGEALVWGRVANDTWGAGTLDVQNGSIGSLTGMSLTNVRASMFQVGGGSRSVSSSLAGNLLITAPQQVLIMSGGGSSSPNPTGFTDVNFFVSGSRNGTEISLFGGNIATSGSVHVGKGGSSSTLSGSGDFSIFFGSNTSDTLFIRNPTHQLSEPVAGFYARGSGYSLELSGGLYVNSQGVSYGGDFLVEDGNNDTTIWSESSTSRLYLSGSQVTINKTSVHGGTDINFYVSGSAGSRGTTTRGTSLFDGDVVISGSSYLGSTSADSLVVNSSLASNIIPDGDRTRNLGSPSLRFANVYTGDLHLRNDRGDWTILEEEDFLCVINNRTGKRYKMMLQPLE